MNIFYAGKNMNIHKHKLDYDYIFFFEKMKTND